MITFKILGIVKGMVDIPHTVDIQVDISHTVDIQVDFHLMVVMGDTEVTATGQYIEQFKFEMFLLKLM